jgi:uncharacterized membrane protein (DUF373 family)
MFDYLKKFEKALVYALMVMMALVLLLATVELGWIIAKDVFTPPVFLLETEELLDIFGLFMLVIIGIELLETIMKTYLMENVNHVEVVFLVAMIAIGRKVIILDIKDVSGITLVGIGAIVITLSVGYYLIKKKKSTEAPVSANDQDEQGRSHAS